MNGIDYSVLFSGSNSASNIAADMLTTIYSTPSAPSTNAATTTGDPILDLKLAEANQTKDVALQAKDPTVMRDLAAFNKGIANAKDVATALKNPDVLKVLLTANGMGDQAQYPALASKILLSDPKVANSLVNQMTDARWKSVTTALSLATKGLAGLKDPKVLAQIAVSYEKVTWLSSLNKATPGLAQAMQFKQQASSIKTVDQILGDPVNWEVVLTALAIPQQIAYQGLPAQEKAVSSRIDIKQLQDPKFVNTLTDQYLLNKQYAAQGSAGSSLDALSVKASGLIV